MLNELCSYRLHQGDARWVEEEWKRAQQWLWNFVCPATAEAMPMHTMHYLEDAMHHHYLYLIFKSFMISIIGDCSSKQCMCACVCVYITRINIDIIDNRSHLNWWIVRFALLHPSLGQHFTYSFHYVQHVLVCWLCVSQMRCTHTRYHHVWWILLNALDYCHCYTFTLLLASKHSLQWLYQLALSTPPHTHGHTHSGCFPLHQLARVHVFLNIFLSYQRKPYTFLCCLKTGSIDIGWHSCDDQ